MKARARKTKKLSGVPAIEATEFEKQLLGCAFFLVEVCPEKVADVFQGMRAGALTVDGGTALAAAIAGECEIDSPSRAGVVHRLSTAAATAGRTHDDDPAIVLATVVANDSSCVNAGTGLLEQWMHRAANEVGAAATQRDELDGALSVMAKHGVSVSGSQRSIVGVAAKLNPSMKRGVPQVMLEPDRRDETVSRCSELLARDFYVFDGAIAAVDRGGPGTSSADDLSIVKVTRERMAAYFSREAVFTEKRRDENGQPITVTVPVPSWIPQWLWGLQVWEHVRPLTGIARGPFLRPDGTIGGTARGYDAATGMLVETDGEWAGIIMEPTQADAEAARDTLLDVIREFSFESPDVARSVWMAALLTVIGRQAFAGPSPMFVINAPTAGSGKGLLSRLISWIANGREPAMTGLPASNAEQMKLVMSLLVERAGLVVFDNVTIPIGGETLDRATTASVFSGRLLGGNQHAKYLNTLTMIANGNNLAVGSDMARRVLHLRLLPEAERPEERVFERGDLVGYVEQNRRKLVAAALTILRRQVITGGPSAAPPVMASFEGWSRMIQQAVVGCGMRDPLASREAVRSRDEGTAARREFIEALAAWDAGFENSARWLWERLHKKDMAGEFVEADDASERLRTAVDDLVGLTGGRGKSEAQSLSKVFTSLDGRLFGSCKLVRGSGRNMTGVVWRLDGARSSGGGVDRSVQPAPAADDLDDNPVARRSGF